MVRKCGGTFEFVTGFYKGKNRVKGVRYRGIGMGMRLALQSLEVSNDIMYNGGPPSPGYPSETPGREGPGYIVRGFE